MRGSKYLTLLAIAALSVPAFVAPTYGAESVQYDLKIEPQPLSSALQEFAKQSGVQIIFFSKVTEGHDAPPLSGKFTAAAALSLLLNDSQLTFRELNPKTIEVQPKAAMNDPRKAQISSAVSDGADAGSARIRLAQNDSAQSRSSSEDSQNPENTNDQPAVSSETEGAKLEEITVTAERREESAQRVPIAMSVFSGDFLKEYVNDPYAVADFTPNYQISASDGLSNSKATIRGLGGDQGGSFTAASVLNYYDGLAADVPFIASLPQWDLDRIEVLRGPQGTLYGRNAVGGAIQYVSAAPTEEFEGYGDFTVGEFDLRRFESAVSGPITENVKARLSALSYNRAGDVTNTFLNTKVGEKDWWGVKGIVDWQISDNFNTQVKARHFEGGADVIRFNVAPGNLLSPGYAQEWLAAIGENPDLPRESNFERYRSALQDPFEDMSFNAVEVDLNYDFGPMALTAIGGYLDGKSVINNSLLTYPVQATDDLLFFDLKQWSGEVRLTSQTDHPLQWIAGAYYQRTEDATLIAEDLSSLLRDLDGDGLTRHNGDSPEDQLDGLIPAFAGVSNVVYVSGDFRNELETHAFFLHTTYEWTDRLATTQAVRYTREDRHLSFGSDSFFEIPVAFGVTPGTPAEHNDFVRFVNLSHAEQRRQALAIIADPNTLDANGNAVPQSRGDSWKELTWRFAADYRLTDDALAYASVSKGFKGGLLGQTQSADPEKSIVYEVGAKAQWFDRLQVNASMFYNDHRDFQTLLLIEQGGVLQNVLENAPKSEIYGAEIEIKVVPFENLLVAANFGILEAEITEVPPGNEALLGHTLPNTEDMNFSGLMRYDVPTALGTFSPQLSGRYRGEYWSRKENNDLTGALGGFWTADLRLGYESPTRKLYGMLYLKNIFDEVQPIFTALPLADIGSSISTINERRNWGVTVGYRF